MALVPPYLESLGLEELHLNTVILTEQYPWLGIKEYINKDTPTPHKLHFTLNFKKIDAKLSCVSNLFLTACLSNRGNASLCISTYNDRTGIGGGILGKEELTSTLPYKSKNEICVGSATCKTVCGAH